MGISRDSIHKKRLTGGKKHAWKKKRKHELGRQPSNTRIGSKQIAQIRVRGGNIKNRALQLDQGNFSWVSSGITRKARIISVAYNASSNELVRTNTLVKSSVIYIEAGPFKNWLIKNENKINEKPKKNTKVMNANYKTTGIEEKENKQPFKKKLNLMDEQINSGRILARICSRPGQVGRADGYVLEGGELEFYLKKIKKK